MVSKTSSFKLKLIGNNAEAITVNRSTLWCWIFPRFRQRTSHCKLLL